jgi:hypothetical protein
MNWSVVILIASVWTVIGTTVGYVVGAGLQRLHDVPIMDELRSIASVAVQRHKTALDNATTLEERARENSAQLQTLVAELRDMTAERDALKLKPAEALKPRKRANGQPVTTEVAESL